MFTMLPHTPGALSYSRQLVHFVIVVPFFRKRIKSDKKLPLLEHAVCLTIAMVAVTVVLC